MKSLWWGIQKSIWLCKVLLDLFDMDAGRALAAASRNDIDACMRGRVKVVSLLHKCKYSDGKL